MLSTQSCAKSRVNLTDSTFAIFIDDADIGSMKRRGLGGSRGLLIGLNIHEREARAVHTER